jgi:hypothetical protein
MFVVLGMHKSGTTLVSRMLHQSGIEMIRTDLDRTGTDYDEGAFFERELVIDLNRQILGFGEPAHRHSKPRRIMATPEQRGEMRRILAQAKPSDARDWGIKEPRLCLTYPLWKPELPEHRLIIVYRTLPEVWNHYSRPQSRRTEAWAVTRAWCDYNECILGALAESDSPSLILRYDTLMTDQAEFERLEKFVGRPLKDVRLPEKYRSRASGQGQLRIVSALRRLTGRTRPAEIADRLEQARQAQR